MVNLNWWEVMRFLVTNPLFPQLPFFSAEFSSSDMLLDKLISPSNEVFLSEMPLLSLVAWGWIPTYKTICLFKVANLACSLSTNEDGMKIVQMAANHIETLCPQVWLFQLIPITMHWACSVLLHNIDV